MNIFNHYGIKEVADVTFYSITKVGDEEFYTPVLFFDTLKVSSMDKEMETVTASGGKGNNEVISWNYGKNISVSLEDALFSKASMDLFMSGRLESKLSNWTSAIAKINIANKYGRKHYSVKAFPSPQLTEAEWEIVFRCAQKAGYCAEFGDVAIKNKDYAKYCKYLFSTLAGDSEEDAYVAENRKFLTQKYMWRNQMSPKSYNIAYYYDFEEGYSGVDMRICCTGCKVQSINDERYWEYTADSDILEDDIQNDLIVLLKDLQNEVDETGIQQTIKIWMPVILRYTDKDEIVRYDDENVGIEIYTSILPHQGFYCRSTNIISTNNDIVIIFNNTYCGYDVFNNHIFYYMFPTKLGEFMDLCYCDLQDKFFLAMPQIVVKEIEKEIDTIRKIGYISDDLYRPQYIDRFESCIVKEANGFSIDALEQKRNIERKYNNDTSESYTIYYDPKTMLPLFMNTNFNIKPDSKKFTELNNCTFTIKSSVTVQDVLKAGMSLMSIIDSDLDKVKEYIKEQTDDDVKYIEDVIFIGNVNDISLSGYSLSFNGDKSPLLVKYTIENQNIFKIRKGTRYFKWTRTVDDRGSIFTSVGTDLIIDADTFSSEYMIVGETYIREQKTGRDQRCQLVFNRVKISPTTKIQLEAAGNPVTFSMDIDVLMSKDKEMMKMTFFDVEEDKTQGGFRIVPQDMRYSYTPTDLEGSNDILNNNEIY